MSPYIKQGDLFYGLSDYEPIVFEFIYDGKGYLTSHETGWMNYVVIPMNSQPPEINQFLLDLAHGKYDAQIAELDKLLAALGAVVPQILIAKKIIDAAIELNRLTAPLDIVKGEGGSWVDERSPRVNPDGTLRPYDPAKDGFLGDRDG